MFLRRHYYRELVLAACGLVSAMAAIAGGGNTAADGFLFDLTLKARALSVAGAGAAEQSPIAVVVLDRRSLDAPELENLPRVLFAPHWASILDAVFSAGARAVGFDIIFTWSANRFKAGYDRPFIAALARHKESVVLARSAGAPVARPFYYALGAGADAGAVGFVELAPDADGVFRRVTARVSSEGNGPSLGLAAAVLERAGGPSMPEAVLLAPRRHLEAIPAYSLIDVVRCAEAGAETLRRAFAGKIILVGTALPEEDRMTTSDRFLAREGRPLPAADARRSGCALSPLGPSDPNSSTVPGVFVHAAAVAAVAGGEMTKTLPSIGAALIAGIAGVFGAWVGLSLTPWFAAGAVVAAEIALVAVGTALIALGFWLPLAAPAGGAAGSVFVAYVARYLAEDRRRRRVQNAFSHYLAPEIVDRLAEAGAELKLGGESRDISVMFADLSGFTALSARVPPAELMEVTNRYLGYIVEAVEATGGYVDKFIGDAVMAMWGAPVDDAEHAVDAVRAARAAVERITVESAAAKARGEIGFSVKIGINSASAAVGNVGAEKRYNYTAVGEVVNIASRLESLPGDYECHIVVGEGTAERLGEAFLLCELDRIKVKGKDESVAIFEPIAETEKATESQLEYVRRYEEALALYRAGDFAGAHERWLAAAYPWAADSQAFSGGPPRVMAARAQEYAAGPPPEPWDGVWVKETK